MASDHDKLRDVIDKESKIVRDFLDHTYHSPLIRVQDAVRRHKFQKSRSLCATYNAYNPDALRLTYYDPNGSSSRFKRRPPESPQPPLPLTGFKYSWTRDPTFMSALAGVAVGAPAAQGKQILVEERLLVQGFSPGKFAHSSLCLSARAVPSRAVPFEASPHKPKLLAQQQGKQKTHRKRNVKFLRSPKPMQPQPMQSQPMQSQPVQPLPHPMHSPADSKERMDERQSASGSRSATRSASSSRSSSSRTRTPLKRFGSGGKGSAGSKRGHARGLFSEFDDSPVKTPKRTPATTPARLLEPPRFSEPARSPEPARLAASGSGLAASAAELAASGAGLEARALFSPERKVLRDVSAHVNAEAQPPAPITPNPKIRSLQGAMQSDPQPSRTVDRRSGARRRRNNENRTAEPLQRVLLFSTPGASRVSPVSVSPVSSVSSNKRSAIHAPASHATEVEREVLQALKLQLKSLNDEIFKLVPNGNADPDGNEDSAVVDAGEASGATPLKSPARDDFASPSKTQMSALPRLVQRMLEQLIKAKDELLGQINHLENELAIKEHAKEHALVEMKRGHDHVMTDLYKRLKGKRDEAVQLGEQVDDLDLKMRDERAQKAELLLQVMQLRREHAQAILQCEQAQTEAQKLQHRLRLMALQTQTQSETPQTQPEEAAIDQRLQAGAGAGSGTALAGSGTAFLPAHHASQRLQSGVGPNSNEQSHESTVMIASPRTVS